MKNIVVLISGNGSNLQAIIDACEQKKINGTIRAVFSNKADAFGLERAREANIPAHSLEAAQFASREAFDRPLMQEIDAWAPDVGAVSYPHLPLPTKGVGEVSGGGVLARNDHRQAQ